LSPSTPSRVSAEIPLSGTWIINGRNQFAPLGGARVELARRFKTSSGNVACLRTISAVYQHYVKDKRLTIGGLHHVIIQLWEMGIFDVT